MTGNSSDVASWYYLVSFQSISKMIIPSPYYEHEPRLISYHLSWQNTRADGKQAVSEMEKVIKN